jgi:choline dehydrogenase-like flavoprotein
MAKSDTKYDYDYFVIGGGSGGVRSSRIASQHGARVALAEAKKLGKTFHSNFSALTNLYLPRWYLRECRLCTKEIVLLCLAIP